MALIQELDQIRREIEENSARASALCEGRSEDDLARRPAPERWSIAENLIHLQFTNAAYLPNIDAAMAAARRQGLQGQGPFRPGMMGRLMVWYMEPPPKFKSPAPKMVIPRLEGSPNEALPHFLDGQQLICERLENANGLALSKVQVQSPLARFLRLDLLSVFRLLAAHERRHLLQAEQVR